MTLLKITPLAVVLLSTGAQAHAQTVNYTEQITPLFETYCIDCHSADDADGGFALDTFAALMKGGEEGASIVAGKADESLLVKFLEGRSGRGGKNEFMPPGKRDKLKAEEIALIKAWINSGAQGPVMSEAKPVAKEVITPKIAPVVAPKRAIQTVAYSESLKLIAVGRYGEVELVNPTTRAVVRKLIGFKGRVNAVTFSSDGSVLYAAGGEAGIVGEVRSWKMADGTALKSFEGHTDACYGIALSPDGKLLATGAYDQKIRLWDSQTGTELKMLKGHNGSVNALAFRPDGKVLASASSDRTVKLWSVPEGARLDTFSQPLKEQNAIVFSLNGQQLFGVGMDSRIRVWQISASAKEGSNSLVTSRFAHEGGIIGLSLSRDGKWLASSATDRSMKIWDAASLTEKVILEKQPDWSPALSFGDQTALIAGRVDGSLSLYHSATGKPIMAVAVAKPKPQAALKTELTRVTPPAIHSGGSVLVTVQGKNLDQDPQVKFSHSSLRGEVIKASIKPTECQVRITSGTDLPRGSYEMWLTTALGSSAKLKLHADDLAPVFTSSMSFQNGHLKVEKLPASRWGTLTQTGQQDVYQFNAQADEELVFDLAVQQVGSAAKSPRLEILDTAFNVLTLSRSLDAGSDPFIAWKAPRTGDYLVRVSNTTLDGSADHHYRLTFGALPYVTGWQPLSVQVGVASTVRFIGHHLGKDAVVQVKPEKLGTLPVPIDLREVRQRVMPSVRVTALSHSEEKENNHEFNMAQVIPTQSVISARLQSPTPGTADFDHFAFEATQGQTWIIETLAAQAGSPSDTKIEILNAQGQPVPRQLMQAVRDSYNNFRSVDANNPDIRLQNWEEMELNEYVYFNGDIMKTFRMPRGPDSGFLFYATGGKRRSYFDTSATSHALDEACYTVIPQPLGAALVPNGLPVFTLNYTNDDEGSRKLGRDSQLTFTAPQTGRYLVRVSDTRGWSGERFVYALTIRQPEPDFTLALDLDGKAEVAPGASLGFSIKADRKDGYEGPISVDIAQVPVGFTVSSPLVIEAGHDFATGSLHALAGAKSEADWSKATIQGRALIGEQTITRMAGSFGKIRLAAAPKFVVHLEPDLEGKPQRREDTQGAKPLELTLVPGQTVKAWIRVDRAEKFDDLINFDVHNLPHGVIIDDIGLNGVQVRAKENERPIFLRCSKWVQEQDRLCHAATASARTEQDSAGLQTSFPILLKIRKPAGVAAR